MDKPGLYPQDITKSVKFGLGGPVDGIAVRAGVRVPVNHGRRGGFVDAFCGRVL